MLVPPRSVRRSHLKAERDDDRDEIGDERDVEEHLHGLRVQEAVQLVVPVVVPRAATYVLDSGTAGG